MPSNKPRLMTYTTKDIVDKFAYIADKESRSISGQLNHIIKLYIEDYESKQGTINLDN